MRLDSLFAKFYCIAVAHACGLAAAFLIGQERRFSGPSFSGLRDLFMWTPWPPFVVWGAIFLLYGAALIWSMGKPIAVHLLRMGVVLYLFLAFGFLKAVLAMPEAAISGFCSYVVVAGTHLILQDHLHDKGWERV